MDSAAANQMLQKEEEDFFNIIESAIDLSKLLPAEIDPMETFRYGNESPPPPPRRSARMNLGIFRDMERPKIVNPSIPTLAAKRKRDIEEGDRTSLTYIKKHVAQQGEHSLPETVTNEVPADYTSRTELTCEWLPTISTAVEEPANINSLFDEEFLTMEPTYSMFDNTYGSGADKAAMQSVYTKELESAPWIAAPHATRTLSYLISARTQNEIEMPIL